MGKTSNIIILHAWGLCGDKYDVLTNLLKKEGYKIYHPDMPGFGKEPLISESMNLDDYVDFLKKYIGKNKILKPVLLGHSFGGRIAIKYAWRYPRDVSMLILTGTPIARDRSFIKKVAYVTAFIGGKTLSKFPKNVNKFFRKVLYTMIGEWDYYKSGPLKQVFKNIIGEDLSSYLNEINIPVYLVWGEKDMIVPYKVVKNKLKSFKGEFILVPETGHKLPYQNPDLFFKIISKYL